MTTTITRHDHRTLLLFIRAGLILLILLGFSHLALHSTTVTGTFRYNGTPFTGTMVVQLTYPSTNGSYINLPVASAPIPISNGTFASLALDGNDTLLPRGTSYSFTLYSPYGSPITRLHYVITGDTFDLGAAVPTPILTNNINYLDLLGIRNFSALNATFTNQIQIGSGAILSALGISNAKQINSIAFAQAYAAQSPSTTCGLQEAHDSLPSTGGIIIAPPGSCNLSTTFTINRPTTLVGFGSGGYADSSAFSTFTSSTLLVGISSSPVIAVTPDPGTTLSGVHIRGLSLSGTAASPGLLALGNPSSTTAFLRHVDLDDVLLHNSGSDGLVVRGSLDDLHMHDSYSVSNPGPGIDVNPGSSYTVGPLYFDHVHSDRNYTGLFLDSATIPSVSVRDSTFDHNSTWGLYATTTSATSSIHISDSSFSYNSIGGAQLGGGYGHAISDSTFISGGSQFTGIGVYSTNSPTLQTASLSNNLFVNNTIADVDVGSTVPYVLFYPQVSKSPVTYTATDWAISAGTATFTVSGNTTIVGGAAIVVSGTVGAVGCTGFNGPHTAATANTTTITFATTCTGSGPSSISYIASGNMTVVNHGGTSIHYMLPAN